MTYNEFMNMPLNDLIDTIFTENGEIKACGRDACRALIERLEKVHKMPWKIGDITTGRLNMPGAYEAAKLAKESIRA